MFKDSLAVIIAGKEMARNFTSVYKVFDTYQYTE